MAFYHYLVKNEVVNLKATEKIAAVDELTRTLLRALKIKKQKPVIEDLLKREESASSFIGNGIAIPIAEAPIDDIAIIVGRSLEGVDYDAARNAKANIIVLIVSNEVDGRDELIELRSEIASFFKSEEVRKVILDSEKEDINISDFVSSYSSETKKYTVAELKKITKNTEEIKEGHIIAAACSLAKDIKAEAIFFMADTVRDNDFLGMIKTKAKIVIVSSNKTRFEGDIEEFYDELVLAPYFPYSRTGLINVGILLALSRGIITKNDKIICVTGKSENGYFDTIVAIDVDKEFNFFLNNMRPVLPQDVKPEVLERVLGLASEIAVEGREGKPTGTIFVLGDTNSVNAHVRQLIINPFRGYTEAERNILDPGLTETIKEFSAIDGAFVITGDGVILSAGSYLRPPSEDVLKVKGLPKGFGARHVAAAAITVTTNAISVTISESTGMITVFKNGRAIFSLTKPVPKHSEIENESSNNQ